MAFLFYFDNMNFLVVNGNLVERDKVHLSPDNHSYRYGDGLFETMKVVNGHLLLREYHFERLFSGCRLLEFSLPTHVNEQKFVSEIKKLIKENNCEELARIRLSVSRGNGGLYDCDNKVSYLIECWPLEKHNSEINRNGLVIDIFPDARKSIDVFSNLKSANYLPYVMAAIWAKDNKVDDALVLNQHNRICDATSANIFWVKDGQVYTPSLGEGCVAGIMRRRILDLDTNIHESILTEDILLNADEVFLTNVIKGIRWVKQYHDKIYANAITSLLFAELNRTISF